VKENKAVFKILAKELAGYGKNSAKASGAFSDVVEVLEEYGIDYEIYDRVANNPSLENVKEGGEAARKFDAILSSESEEARLWTLRGGSGACDK